MGNVLNSNELVTISILQQIKIELLTEKARIQRDGRALEEAYLDDEPQKSDYVSDENTIEGTVTFDQLLEKQLNAPTPIEQLMHEVEKLDVGTTEDAQDNAHGDMVQIPQKKKPKPSKFAEIHAWLVSRSVWRVTKSKLDYEHNRTKADVVNMCYGIDFAIDIIDREIDRQKTGKSVKVEIPTSRGIE